MISFLVPSKVVAEMTPHPLASNIYLYFSLSLSQGQKKQHAVIDKTPQHLI